MLKSSRTAALAAPLFVCLSLASLLTGGLAAATLPEERGAAGTWQKLLKLQTTASALHTRACAWRC